MMTDGVVIEVTRGGLVESRHRGALAVCDADGGVVLARGDIDAPVFPRSAIKALQALPLVESGAVDVFGLTAAEIALACASHSGEPEHALTAHAMLVKAGRDTDALECGCHWPMNEAAARALAAAGDRPSALHNNCSGKHAGFVCLACALDENPAGYVRPGHMVQREAKAVIEAMTGVALGPEVQGVDGCSIPTWAVPLRALATGFARFGTGHGLGAARADAARKIRDSVAAHPFMVAGRGRFDTDVMLSLGARVFTKVGAEGVFCAAFPDQGLGVALKIEDGAGRAAEVLMAAVIAAFVQMSDAEKLALRDRLAPRLVNWNGIEVGGLRLVGSVLG